MRDKYEQWLNTAFSPCMDIICFHIFSVLLCISLPSVVFFEHYRGLRGEQNAKTKKKKRVKERKWGLFAFEPTTCSSKRITSVFSINTVKESALHLLLQSLLFFLSVCILVSQCRWTNIKHPKEISHPHFTPEKTLYIESHDHLSVHLNSVWSDVGGEFWVFHWGL